MATLNIEKRNWEKSSLINETVYNESHAELFVTFNNGGKYLFQEVSANEYAEFCAAESQGSFFSKNINKKKPFIVVEKAESTKKEKATEDGDKESI
jgi:hypothetical protein